MNAYLIIFINLAFFVFTAATLCKRYALYKNKEIELIELIGTIIIATTCFIVQAIMFWAICTSKFQLTY